MLRPHDEYLVWAPLQAKLSLTCKGLSPDAIVCRLLVPFVVVEF
jgi:hypothetical protein